MSVQCMKGVMVFGVSRLSFNQLQNKFGVHEVIPLLYQLLVALN